MSFKAYIFAKEKHKGQKRKFTGEDYFTHPERVAAIVKRLTHDDTMENAALLHDTLEDTDANYTELSLLFGNKVADLVKELTSDESQMDAAGGKAQYLTNKMNKMSTKALTVKLADRLSNVEDFGTANPKWRDKYKAQTEFILDNLTRKLDIPQQKLVKEIRSIIEKF